MVAPPSGKPAAGGGRLDDTFNNLGIRNTAGSSPEAAVEPANVSTVPSNSY
jgi:hypothetical protein